MTLLLSHINTVFDRRRDYWEGHTSKSLVAVLILMSYLLSPAAIELGRRSVLPRSHNAAINVAFTFLLYLELVELVRTEPQSVLKRVNSWAIPRMKSAM